MSPRFRNKPDQGRPNGQRKTKKQRKRERAKEHKEKIIEKNGTCSICDRERELDFHHWVYSPGEMGCYVCRECHKRIHGSKNSRPRETAGNEWVDEAISNAVTVYSEHNHWLNGRRIMRELSIPHKFSQVVEKAVRQAGGGADD